MDYERQQAERQIAIAEFNAARLSGREGKIYEKAFHAVKEMGMAQRFGESKYFHSFALAFVELARLFPCHCWLCRLKGLFKGGERI